MVESTEEKIRDFIKKWNGGPEKAERRGEQSSRLAEGIADMLKSDDEEVRGWAMNNIRKQQKAFQLGKGSGAEVLSRLQAMGYDFFPEPEEEK